MRGWLAAVVFFALLLGTVQYVQADGSAHLTIATDQSAHSPGQTITFTVTNTGDASAQYTQCAGGPFVVIYDSAGNKLVTANPAIMAPCRVEYLAAGQSAVTAWNQIVYSPSPYAGAGATPRPPGSYYGSGHQAPDGVYAAVLLDGRATFAIGGSSTPTPSPSPGTHIVLSTDKSSYPADESVSIIATNEGTTAVGYSPCKPSYTITDANGNQLTLFPPGTLFCMAFASISPGQTATIGRWNQKAYSCPFEYTGIPTRCGMLHVPAGLYTAHFYDGSASFTLEGGASPTPPSPPVEQTFTVHANAGWNLFSVPVYSLVPAPCFLNLCMGVVGRHPAIVSSTCSSGQVVWAYEDGAYRQESLGGISPGSGHWLHADSACDITFGGDSTLSPGQYRSQLTAGWNLIGAPSLSTALTALSGDCSITSGPWGYSNGAYSRASALEPGVGYWVKAAAECTLGNANNPPTPRNNLE